VRFESYYFLLLLVLIPLLYRYWQRQNLPPRIFFPLTAKKEARAFNPSRASLWFRCLALALLIVALARPQTAFRETERSVSGVDIMLVMDVSASMNIEDLDERSRFSVAKETLENFVKSRSNDRIGLVVFSGEALTLTPVTLDHSLVLKSIKEARSGILKDGTAIGDGLATGVSRLRDSHAKPRIIVLLTDGDSNVGQVDPLTAGDLATGFGIRTYTIAIGTEGRVRMPIRQSGPFGQEIVTYQWFDNALNTELLEKIAANTKAKFYRVTDAGTLTKVFQEIDALEKTELKTTEKTRYDDHYQLFLKWGVALFVLEQALSLLWWRRVV